MSIEIPLIVHATHEAGIKMGGIGAVLEGLLSAPAYKKAVGRTVIIGPFDVHQPQVMERLVAKNNGLSIIYSSLPGLVQNNGAEAVTEPLQAVERRYNAHLLYGKRQFGEEMIEVLLVDPSRINGEPMSAYKRELWERWQIDSLRFDGDKEYNFYLNSAEPGYAALKAIIPEIPAGSCLLAHEFMGIPLALSARLHDGERWLAAYYAHEVPAARSIVEHHSGHDTRFYNTIELAFREKLSLSDFFGDFSGYAKHALLSCIVRKDRLTGLSPFQGLLAVGDRVMDELKFLGGGFRSLPIRLAYNGVPTPDINLAAKHKAKSRMQTYSRNLFGFTPDYVFTHVTRAVTSKGLWRDIRLLEQLDLPLARAGKRAVFFLLATSEPAGRDAQQVRLWEKRYGWPVNHREDNGDLLHHEAVIYRQMADFWTKGIFGGGWSRAIKAVMVNQYGWSHKHCGEAMPADMQFSDIRYGSDLEFGMSIYEPFGIAPLEPLSAGALSVISNACGCAGFVARANQELGLQSSPNVMVGDFISLPAEEKRRNPLTIDLWLRDKLEVDACQALSQSIMAQLPRNQADEQRLLLNGQVLASTMSWEVAASQYFLPALKDFADKKV